MKIIWLANAWIAQLQEAYDVFSIRLGLAS
jgi:hypothetical protein